MPFLPIILQQYAHFNMATIGGLLGIGVLIRSSGGIVGGIITQAIGARSALITALVLRAVGYLILWFALLAGLVPCITIALLLIPSSTALYSTARKTILFCCAETAQQRALFLALSRSITNAGMATGLLMSSLLLVKHLQLLFCISITLSFLVTLALSYWLNVPKSSAIPQHGCSAPERYTFSGLQIIALPLLLNTLVFYVFSFFIHYLGPYTSALASRQLYSYLLALNCLLITLLQPLCSRWLKAAPYLYLMSCAFIALGSGFFCISLGSSSALIGGVLLITLAELAFFLKSELIIADRLHQTPALAFGLTQLSSGIGAAMSGCLGGLLYDHYQHQMSLFWQLITLKCFVVATLVLIYYRHIQRRESQRIRS